MRPHSMYPLLTLLMALSLALSACGGGGGGEEAPPGGNPPPVENGFVTFDALAIPVLSGLVRDEQEPIPAVGMAVGDVELDGVRGIVSFNITEMEELVTELLAE